MFTILGMALMFAIVLVYLYDKTRKILLNATINNEAREKEVNLLYRRVVKFTIVYVILLVVQYFVLR